MLGYNAISRPSRLDFDDLGVMFITLAPLWGSNLPPWDHLRSTLEALFVSKNRLGRQRCAKGAPRGATTKVPSPIWAPFRGHFSDFFEFLMQKSVYLTRVAFFLNFGRALSVVGDGLLCNPSTPAQSKHTFQFLHFFIKMFPKGLKISQCLSNF